MAIFKKTLTYNLSPSANPADVVNNTSTQIGSASVFVPENSSTTPVRFTSVMLFVANQDVSTVTGATISNFQISCSLNGTFSGSVDAGSLANSGENWSFVRAPYDFTNHFNSLFGTANSASVLISYRANVSTGTGTDTRAVYCWMDITYEYSSSASGKGQTLYIPIASNSGSLPTVQTKFTTIPQVSGSGGLLQNYNALKMRRSYIELRGNSNVNNNATDIVLSYTFDSNASANTLPSRENALATDTYNTYIIPYPAASASSAHTFELWSSVATRFQNIAMFLCTTFEYVSSSMTTIMNNIRIPIEFESPIDGTTTAKSHRFHRVVKIPEPGPITPKFVGIDLTYNTNASATPLIRGFSQTNYTPYAMNANVVGGMFGFLHVVSASTEATFSQGENDIKVDLYRSAGSMTNVSGLLHLIYESGIYVSGSEYHSKYISSYVRQFSQTTVSDEAVTDFFNIPEPYHWLQAIGLNYNSLIQVANATYMIQARQNTNENFGDAWREIYNDQYSGDNELSYGNIQVAARDTFKRFPLDYDSSRMSVTSSRLFRTTSSTAFRYGYYWSVSYFTCNFSLNGTISNSNGGAVTLSLHRSDTGEKLQESSRTGNGAFSFIVYDPVLKYYVDAYESNSFKGRSNTSASSGSFDISLTAGGEKSYTWIG